MQYGKLINGSFIPFTGKYIRANGRVYVNPKKDTLIKSGYKPLTVAEYPEEQEGFCISVVYLEADAEIIQSYEYIEIQDEDEVAEEETDISMQKDI
ncbi:MAG: hypothetical protein Q4G33_15390 [bacterium]|nr:hypothetical protein [bacterium]